MGIPLHVSSKATLCETDDTSSDHFTNLGHKNASILLKEQENNGDSSVPFEQKEIQDDPIDRIQKSTWRRIKDWCTRAYRISEVAKKRPERVKNAGKHILMLGMVLGFAPNLISSLTKTLRGTQPSHNGIPTEPHRKAPLAKKSSERLPIITLSADDKPDSEKDDDISKDTQTSDHENQQDQELQPYAKPSVITDFQPQVRIAIHNDLSPKILESRIPTLLHDQAPSADTLIGSSRTIDTPDIPSEEDIMPVVSEDSPRTMETALEPDTPLSLMSTFRGREQELLSAPVEDPECRAWKETPIRLSLSEWSMPDTYRSEDMPDTDADFDETFELRLDPFSSRSIPPLPDEDLLRQLTYEHGEILPMEIAYESLMRIMINGSRKLKRLFKPEKRVIDMTEERRTTHVRLRTGFEDLISGGDAQLRISFKRIILKAGVDIELPFDMGELEVESISRVELFEKMPLTRQTFQMTYEHPFLGGQVQLRGAVDYEPSQESPFTFSARARFNRMIYNNAAVNIEGNYEQVLGSEPFFGITAGIAFTWGPASKQESIDPYQGMDSTERGIRRRVAPYKIGERLIRAGRKLQNSQERDYQRN